MPALAAGLNVGLVALTRHTPSGGDRLLTLQSGKQGGAGRSVCG